MLYYGYCFNGDLFTGSYWFVSGTPLILFVVDGLRY